ncbi:hypothetical protein, partial [Micromonospora sp. DT47]|uniref:hypothetical protein n=1 Tax=Micromonospora sp. DT47 TaxID=3393431 RepID=UPI003CEC0D14
RHARTAAIINLHEASRRPEPLIYQALSVVLRLLRLETHSSPCLADRLQIVSEGCCAQIHRVTVEFNLATNAPIGRNKLAALPTAARPAST